MGCAAEMLAAGLDPLNRATESQRRQRDRQLLGIDVLLDPKAAAHVWRNHPDDGLRQLQSIAQRLAEGVRPLCGGPDRQPTAAGVEARQHAAGLDGHSRVALHSEASAYEQLRAANDGVRITHAVAERGQQVARRVFMQLGCSSGKRLLRLHHSGQRVEFGTRQRLDHSVFRRVAIPRHDDRHRITDIADAPLGQRSLLARPQVLLRDDDRDGRIGAQLSWCEDRCHACHGAGCSQV